MSDGLTCDSNRASVRLRGVSLVVVVEARLPSCLGVCSTDSNPGGVCGRGGGLLGVSKERRAAIGGDDDSCAGGGAVSMRFFVGVVEGETMALAAAAPSVDSNGDDEGSLLLLKESEVSRRRFRGRPRRFLGSMGILAASKKAGRGRGLGAARLMWEGVFGTGWRRDGESRLLGGSILG